MVVSNLESIRVAPEGSKLHEDNVTLSTPEGILGSQQNLLGTDKEKGILGSQQNLLGTDKEHLYAETQLLRITVDCQPVVCIRLIFVLTVPAG